MMMLSISKIQHKILLTSLGAFFLVPFVVNAQSIGVVINNIAIWVNRLVPVAFALGLIFFFYAVAKYILALGNEDKRSEAKQLMLWGIIALFVMASVWGLVYFIRDSFGVTDDSAITAPRVNSTGSSGFFF
jgi:hypothetical protein